MTAPQIAVATSRSARAEPPRAPVPRSGPETFLLYSLVLLDTGTDGTTRLFRKRDAAEKHVLSHLQKVHQYPGVAYDAAMMRFWIHHRGIRMAWNISEHRTVIE